MDVFILIIYLILVGYSINIFWLCVGFTKVKKFSYKQVDPKTTFSIIVPFRNENENLPNLLASFKKINYPSYLFEVILVDDDSDVKFEVLDYNYKIVLIDTIRKSDAPKKTLLIQLLL
ncbi:glycosyltransferase [Flavobacterium davisii]|uniref:glycosyltransferase n=1 Tax=Flavobacterium davisii TaxID=2906077 RepID=UPI0021646915|nr:glycosyltransferase [Flavobacterium davisii]